MAWRARNATRQGYDMSDPDAFSDDRSPLRPGNAAAALLLTPTGDYVLQHRDAKSGIFFPDHWGHFGGEIELSDASIEAGLCRELAEELGLGLHPAQLVPFTTLTFDFSYCGHGVLWRAYYEARLAEGQLSELRIAEGHEVQAFQARDAFARLRLVPYDGWVLWMHANRARLSGTGADHG
jgi:8-oxo-dGTP pyrophosphatase MutT (NUDIX family)